MYMYMQNFTYTKKEKKKKKERRHFEIQCLVYVCICYANCFHLVLFPFSIVFMLNAVGGFSFVFCENENKYKYTTRKNIECSVTFVFPTDVMKLAKIHSRVQTLRKRIQRAQNCRRFYELSVGIVVCYILCYTTL